MESATGGQASLKEQTAVTNMVTLENEFEQVTVERSTIEEVILTADGRSNSKIHTNSNSMPLLLTRK